MPDQKTKELLAALQGNRCACGGEKRARVSFCGKCYGSLPRTMQRDLYRRFGDGYEAAYQKALNHLQLDQQKLL